MEKKGYFWALSPLDEYRFNKLKRKKISKAIEKGYSPHPEYHSFEFLLKRLKDEVQELINAVQSANINEAKEECADVANIVEFIYKKLEVRSK